METVLEFTSLGNAIISELLQVAALVPDEYREYRTIDKKFSDILMDFNYFKIEKQFEKKIEADQQLSDLDEFIRESYSDVLVRFYLAFESIYEYANNFTNFIRELSAGEIIQESLETIFQDPEGCQLICEALYLYAVMLIVLDIHLPGSVREKLLVSYYRYHSQNSESSIEDICKFCRSTGYNPITLPYTTVVHYQPHNASKGYPENFFSRVQLDENFVSMVIETLKTEDIYHQMQKFPSPEHRTIALASQSAMLYACLYFQPETLMNQQSRMREICDKFYYNNWIISLYMGLTVNLLDAWDGYKAAKSALTNILQPQMIKEITVNNDRMLKKMLESTRGLLKEGVLNETFLMKNLQSIVKVIRECNFCVRWWILNSSQVYTKKSKPFYDIVRDSVGFSSNELYDLILNISQLELCVRDIVKDLLENKESKWTGYKAEVDERMNEMILLFSGETLVIKLEKNDQLRAWFTEMLKEIAALDLQNKPRAVEKKLINIIQAVTEVQDLYNIQGNAHAKQRIDEMLASLSNMIHLLVFKDSVLVDIQAIGDFNYAWYLIEDFTDVIHKSIQKSPNILIRLRALFIKISSALEIPLLRINQCGGAEELVDITKYYSNELVKYVRRIVQIIPHSIFNILKTIIELQTNHLKELPERLEKDKIREYAQLDDRYKIAKLTFQISVFTDGILAMKKTLVGVIELDPKQLLEDGIRMELITSVSNALNDNLQFQGKPKNAKELLVVENLTTLSRIMDGYRRSFEYIQDYLNINGLKIWQEELMRLINFNVEQECNSFMRRKVQFSRFQSSSIPIPLHPPLNDSSITFIGRLGRELLLITEPKSTIYVDLLTSWFEVKSHQELINQKFTGIINESIEIYGLVGLDKLYSYMISDQLDTIYKMLLKETFKEKQWIEQFQKFAEELNNRKKLNNKESKLENPLKHYQGIISKCNKSLPNILPHVLSIGHKQIWRNHIAHELTTTSRLNCRDLNNSLKAFNE